MKKIDISGSPFEIGLRLGELGREAWHQKLMLTSLWQTVMTLQASPETRLMRAEVQRHYPHIWQELEGLAQGLEASVDQVFAWNCRGDLVRSTSDGCTTVAGVNAAGERIIAHNEDGFPQLRDECLLATITPSRGLSFTSFAYPGSICGHTFAVNEKGIVNTVNNIRAVHRPQGLPRQILARASLNANTLDEAITILTGQPRSGAFHHTLGQLGDARLFSVEATGQGCSVLPLTTVTGHANHLVHAALAGVEQIVTDSSASRQLRLVQWRETQPPFDAAAAKAILSDTHDAELPIYRLAADDPDEENTLATAVFTLDANHVRWQIFDINRDDAKFQGEVRG
ncbi:TPA: acyl-CoA--6-aminopenicillanic acid acyl-transferase [Klebsiella michiganensis]|uniref:C45 family autoproteolytic acyltransferase/hydolase n=1 Tax=Klebsiella TaxID=570 RepID=UPI001CCFF40F|nr:C45 family peptidase [Klebsiella michiganensis]GJK62871.1 peptidase C45 [Klebsiella oxytoca]MBZ7503225.1 acyl-CoA--6-aminopenicillanic acid acyl-transferase [Klebsiella michiganensis]HBM2905906.1 acyl-CoA--6-aminopenicillanic acid acyl-transferase [Klebsiella michiganensis]HBM2910204.1 acyl-CoA--6-aminopenicillanic acid acyl-transferase [Klebsiella michiganensis]HDX8781587.1 acyl-CoA--6-aminopenicillanic acid acyl-transferase [Klebsiella michiganensis]